MVRIATEKLIVYVNIPKRNNFFVPEMQEQEVRSASPLAQGVMLLELVQTWYVKGGGGIQPLGAVLQGLISRSADSCSKYFSLAAHSGSRTASASSAERMAHFWFCSGKPASLFPRNHVSSSQPLPFSFMLMSVLGFTAGLFPIHIPFPHSFLHHLNIWQPGKHKYCKFPAFQKFSMKCCKFHKHTPAARG